MNSNWFKLVMKMTKVEYGKNLLLKGVPIIFNKGGAKLKIGGNVTIKSSFLSNLVGLYSRTIIVTRASGAEIEIGDNVGISGATIYARKKITIGENTCIGGNCKILDNDFHPIEAEERNKLLRDENGGESDLVPSREIKIGKNCFIGCNSIILKGTVLGDGCVVGAGAVVCGKFKRIMHLSSVGVVHTDAIFNEVKDAGIENVVHIEYPHFSTGYDIDKAGARKYYGLSENAFVLGCIGGTRYDKGLDILLKALRSVTGDFELLIAGAEDAIKREKIEELARPYRDRVKLHLSFLTDEEFEMAIQAVDAIVLPYRKTFNGASGPLGEGVAKGKMIIAANHGSLGDIVEKNHLGYTFESENIEALKKVLNMAIQRTNYTYDEKANAYKNKLSINEFKKQYCKLYF